jgi:hypothetical protein
MQEILNMMLNAGGGGAVKQLAGQFGLSEQQTGSALGALLPALAGGLQSNLQKEGGLDGLLGALGKGNHGRYLDDASALGGADAIADGNGILGHILGSKDVSRQVAAQAAEKAGVGSDIMKQMLPLAATMLMGSLGQKTSQAGLLGNVAAGLAGGGASAGGGGGLGSLLGAAASMLGGGQAPQASSGAMGLLSGLLDTNRNGSSVDELIGMAGKFFQR